MSSFKPATRTKVRGRMLFYGPSKSGKTFSSLRALFTLGKKIAVVASEPGRAEKYLGESPDGVPWQFDIAYPETFSPENYTKLIIEAGKAGYDGILIDSLTHAWSGAGGALELVDALRARNAGNSFAGWKDVTPMHNRLLDAIGSSPAHVACTLRTQTDWVLEVNEKGKNVPRKIGTKPVQREGVEYEFDIEFLLDMDHYCTVNNTNCPAMDKKCMLKPNAEFFLPYKEWLEKGSETPAGYYEARQDEIDRKMREQETEARAEMTPQEKMAAAQAKRAAKAAGTSGTITTTPPATKPGAVVLCSDEQAEDVRGLLNAVFIKRGRPVAEGVKFLQSIGGEVCVRAMMLTPAQADTAIERLKNMLAQGEIITDTLGHQGAGTEANSPAAAQPTSEGKSASTTATATTPAAQEPPFDVPARDATDTNPAMVSVVQLKAIKDLVAELGIPHDVQVKSLQKRGVNAFQSLTAAQADEMLAGLRDFRDKKLATAGAEAKK